MVVENVAPRRRSARQQVPKVHVQTGRFRPVSDRYPHRGYQKNQIQPLFPFGFGLSYTNFSFSNLNLEPAKFTGSSDVIVTFTVTNTGNRAGAEVAQLYVGQQNPTISRPIRELKGFQKIFLQPGQSQKVTLTLNQRSFAYFNETTHQWDALAGKYGVLVGSSSQDSDLKLTGAVDLPSEITANP